MKTLCLAIILIFAASVQNGIASVYRVADAKDIAALKNIAAGDTVLMAPGEWKDQKIVFRADGRPVRPVVLMAEKAGETIMTGSSKLSFSGNYIVVSGLYFRDIELESDAVISFRAGSGRFANHSVLKDCTISGRGLKESMTDYKWVSIYGTANEVSNCTFIDKSNMGTLMVVWLQEDVPAGHLIKGNYFSRPRSILQDGKAVNGQETLRIGTSQVSMQTASCVVEGNFFYRCNGEVETISNKSCGNIYRGNVFTECAGTLTLRHGNDCEVYGNAFYGAGAENTGGVRLIGERHKVYNNYFQDLTGTGYYSAICLVQGEKEPALSGYFRAEDCYVVHNTIVNCRWGINVNHGSARQTEPVANNIIANNVIVNYKDEKVVNIIVRHTPLSPVNTLWKNNIVYSARLRDIDAVDAGAEEFDPDIRSYKGFFVPLQKTALSKKTVEGFDFVQTDFFANARESGQVVPSAFNIIKKIDHAAPDAKTTGVKWKLK